MNKIHKIDLWVNISWNVILEWFTMGCRPYTCKKCIQVLFSFHTNHLSKCYFPSQIQLPFHPPDFKISHIKVNQHTCLQIRHESKYVNIVDCISQQFPLGNILLMEFFMVKSPLVITDEGCLPFIASTNYFNNHT